MTQEGDTVSHRDNAPFSLPPQTNGIKISVEMGWECQNGMHPHALTHACTHARTHARTQTDPPAQIRFEIREPVSGVEIEHITYI